jgi:hypothetical protein
MKDHFRLSHRLKTIEIVIIECPNFDDALLGMLAQALPESVTALSLDFSGYDLDDAAARV